MTNNLFEALGLKKAVLKAVKNIGYVKPTPVQAEFIPVALKGRDALASAQTGSGKTSAYTIPVLNKLLDEEEKTALFVAPTRELAQQIQTVFRDLAKDAGINTALITGGKNMQGQLRKLKTNPRVIIGTPGRLNDHLKRKSLKLDKTAVVVWDETDRMLDLGFMAQIEEIISFLPAEKQTLMLSATFPPRVLKLAQKYLNNPEQIIIGGLNNPSENVEQKNIKIEGNDKLKKLTEILTKLKGQALVFVKTQRTAAEITRYLKKNLIDAGALHGGLKQKDRDAAMKGFRAQEFKILVATDVAARGLDIPSISTVINYELPQNPEEYIHRLGRTGRYDQTGVCINLIARADRSAWKEIKAFLEKQSSGEDIAFPAQEEKLCQTPKSQSEAAELKHSVKLKEPQLTATDKTASKKIPAKTNTPPAAQEQNKAEEYVFTPFKKVYVGKVKEEKPKRSKKAPAFKKVRKNGKKR